MNLRAAVPLCLLLLVPLGAALRSPAEVEAPARDEALVEAMEQMNGALRQMLKGIDASSRDKALEHVAKFQSGLLRAKLETPKDAGTPEKRVAFRKLLVEVLATSCKLETALLDGRLDEANKLVKEDLTRLKKEGHDQFQTEEED